MTDLLHRTTGTGLDERSTPTITPEYAPPDHLPPTEAQPTAPWPRNARVVVALLLVVALLGMFGIVLAITSTDDVTPIDPEAQQTIDELTVERNDLVAQVASLQTEIDAASAERDDVVAQVAILQAEIDATTVERDALVDDLAALELTAAEVQAVRDDLVDRIERLEVDADVVVAERDALIEELARLDGRVVALSTERGALVDRVAELEADLLEQSMLATSAIWERDALAAMFPIRVDAAVDVDTIADTYDVDETLAFCNGFGVCDASVFDEMVIRKTTNDRLELRTEGNPTAGMMLIDGALYAVFDSSNAAPECGGVPRLARVAVTVFPQTMTVADDGTARVATLGASTVVSAPATATCAAGTAFYGAQLTP